MDFVCEHSPGNPIFRCPRQDVALPTDSYSIWRTCYTERDWEEKHLSGNLHEVLWAEGRSFLVQRLTGHSLEKNSQKLRGMVLTISNVAMQLLFKASRTESRQIKKTSVRPELIIIVRCLVSCFCNSHSPPFPWHISPSSPLWSRRGQSQGNWSESGGTSERKPCVDPDTNPQNRYSTKFHSGNSGQHCLSLMFYLPGLFVLNSFSVNTFLPNNQSQLVTNRFCVWSGSLSHDSCCPIRFSESTSDFCRFEQGALPL